jgi:hypothetical protein
VLSPRRDLAKLGGILFVGLIGVIVAALLGLVIHLPLLHLGISVVAAALFTGFLVYYDCPGDCMRPLDFRQPLRREGRRPHAAHSLRGESRRRAAVGHPPPFAGLPGRCRCAARTHHSAPADQTPGLLDTPGAHATRGAARAAGYDTVSAFVRARVDERVAPTA